MNRGVVTALVTLAFVGATAADVRSGPASARVAGGATTVAPSSSTLPPTPPGAVTTAPTGATTPTLPEPADEAVDPVRRLVPRIASIPAVLTEPDDRRAAIDRALIEPSNAIAVEDGPGTLCAVVPVSAPLMADGRWERSGQPIASTGMVRRDPPGFGDCIPNDDGEPFRDGVYQYVAVGATGARSAAATVVIGVVSVVVWLLNDGDEPVCMVHASPTEANFYEAFATSSPLQPGQAMGIRIADVDQDVRVFGCPPDDVLRTLRISPQPQTYVALFDSSEEVGATSAPPASEGAPEPSSPPTPSTSTSATRPTTGATTTTTTA